MTLHLRILGVEILRLQLYRRHYWRRMFGKGNERELETWLEHVR